MRVRFRNSMLRKLKNRSTNTIITKECMKTARTTKNITVKKAAKAAPTANADVKTAKSARAKKVRNVRATATKNAAKNTAAVHASTKKAVPTANADAKRAKSAAAITESIPSRRCLDISPDCTILTYGSIR